MKDTFNGAFGFMTVGFGATAVIMMKEGLFKEASACLVITTIMMMALAVINRFVKEQKWESVLMIE